MHSGIYIEIPCINLVVFWEVGIFLRNKNALWEMGEHKWIMPVNWGLL